jgi:DNA polymerase-4
LDEAYLDVTEVTLCKNSATLMAKKIRQEILTTQGLTASAGIAPNKFLAKVASDWNKPNGQKVITPDEVSEFVYQLPVNCISGVGKVTAKRMTALNLKTCGDLQALGTDKLKHYFGKFGDSLYNYSKGIDHRPVKNQRVRKSLSVEDTFPTDLPDLQSCLEKLPVIYEELLTRLERAQQQQRLSAKTLFIKIRFDDFETTTLQTPGTKADLTIYQGLCKQAWQRGQRPVRLIGIGLQFNPPDLPEQLPLFKEPLIKSERFSQR